MSLPQTAPEIAASGVQVQVSGALWFWKVAGQAPAALAGAATVKDELQGP